MPGGNGRGRSEAAHDAGTAQANGHQGAAPDDAEGPVAAAAALLLLSSVAGIRNADVLALRRQFVDALDLTLLERHRLDDLLYQLAQQPVDRRGVRRRFTTFTPADQAAAGDVLVAVAAATGGLEPAHVAVLAEVFALLGLGEPELNRRLHEMEVASVTFDEYAGPMPIGTDVIAFDLAETARILGSYGEVADRLVSAVLGPPPPDPASAGPGNAGPANAGPASAGPGGRYERWR